MTILDDLRTAAASALSAGATAARGQGVALARDFEASVKPNLEGILAQIASISAELVAGDMGADEARDLISIQLDGVQPIILAAAELAVLALQTIINAVLDALKTVVNTASTKAVGIALF